MAAIKDAAAQLQGMVRGHQQRENTAMVNTMEEMQLQAGQLQAGILGATDRRRVETELANVYNGQTEVIQAAIRGKESRSKALADGTDVAMSAATIVQAVLRGRDDREAFGEMRDEECAAASTTLLAGLEGRVTRTAIADEMSQSAAQVKAMFASRSASVAVTNGIESDEHAAAGVVQGVLRGRRAREALAKQLGDMDQSDAAALLQAVLRGSRDRDDVDLLLAEEYDGAASTIQNGLEGMLTRRVVSSELSESVTLAVERVRAMLSACNARAETEEVREMSNNEAAALVQGILRGREGRQTFVAMLREMSENDAASLVQAIIRGRDSRHDTNDVKSGEQATSVASLKGVLAGMSTRRRQLEQGEAVSLVQAIIRGRDDRQAAHLLYAKQQELAAEVTPVMSVRLFASDVLCDSLISRMARYRLR